MSFHHVNIDLITTLSIDSFSPYLSFFGNANDSWCVLAGQKVNVYYSNRHTLHIPKKNEKKKRVFGQSVLLCILISIHCALYIAPRWWEVDSCPKLDRCLPYKAESEEGVCLCAFCLWSVITAACTHIEYRIRANRMNQRIEQLAFPPLLLTTDHHVP